MLLSEIAEMQGFNQLGSGEYVNLEDELQAFVSTVSSAKSLKTKLTKALVEYNAKLDGQAEAKIQVLQKGAEAPIQFTPTAGFKSALEAVITAVNSFETAVGAVNLPTA